MRRDGRHDLGRLVARDAGAIGPAGVRPRQRPDLGRIVAATAVVSRLHTVGAGGCLVGRGLMAQPAVADRAVGHAAQAGGGELQGVGAHGRRGRDLRVAQEASVRVDPRVAGRGLDETVGRVARGALGPALERVRERRDLLGGHAAIGRLVAGEAVTGDGHRGRLAADRAAGRSVRDQGPDAGLRGDHARGRAGTRGDGRLRLLGFHDTSTDEHADRGSDRDERSDPDERTQEAEEPAHHATPWASAGARAGATSEPATDPAGCSATGSVRSR